MKRRDGRRYVLKQRGGRRYSGEARERGEGVKDQE